VRSLALALALLLCLPALARAHEVLHEVRAAGAVAVKFFESDGDLLDDAPFEIWSPAEAKGPWQRGRTDRGGWLAFVPAAPGRWRIKVVGEDGHGAEVVVDTAALSPGTAPAAAPAPLPGVAFVLRPLLGVLLVGALFGGLVVLYRKKARR